MVMTELEFLLLSGLVVGQRIADPCVVRVLRRIGRGGEALHEYLGFFLGADAAGGFLVALLGIEENVSPRFQLGTFFRREEVCLGQ